MKAIRSPITGPTAWTAGDIDLEQVVLRPPDDLGVGPATGWWLADDVDSTAEDGSPLASLGSFLARELGSGPGFVVLRGSGFELAPDPAHAFWLIVRSLGETKPQNAAGARVHMVESGPSSPGHARAGGSTGHNEILLHTENARPPRPPRFVALGCLEQSPEGGTSTLCSGHTIYNRLLAEEPELVDRLMSPFAFGRHDEPFADGNSVDLAPVIRATDHGLAIRYSRYWLDVAVRTTGHPLDRQAAAAAAAVDALLASPDLVFRFRLEPGDVIVFDNHIVLHGRDSFDPERGPRRLLRAWVASPGRHVPSQNYPLV